MIIWRCGFCGYEIQRHDKPVGPCPQCNDQVWEEQRRSEEVKSDHLRPAPGQQ